jgi:glycosyltransferase involved in cell wall biosynthesis
LNKIAVLIPCHNEEVTIGKVVSSFRAALPDADIHVYDNASTDRTADAAKRAGAITHFVASKGKGNVVRAMFRDIDADCYLLVDGDDTYPATHAQRLVGPVLEGRADMVVGVRLAEYEVGSFRSLHVFGNRAIAFTINSLFGAHLADVLTGYRAFSRRFVKTMPVLSRGFEIESEMTLHALDQGFVLHELAVPYGTRPQGSVSKLHTFKDGYRVLKTIFQIFKDYRPLLFFGTLGMALLAVSLVLGLLTVEEFARLQRVEGVARAVLGVAAGIAGLLLGITGLLLDTINRRMRANYVLIADQVIHADKPERAWRPRRSSVLSELAGTERRTGKSHPAAVTDGPA